MPKPIPERVWVACAPSNPRLGAWSDYRMDDTDTEYVRADLCALASDPEPNTGHWAGVEMQQLRYLLSSMTGRTLAEVSEPASELCHRLRYGSKTFEDRPGMVVTELEAWEYEGEDGG